MSKKRKKFLIDKTVQWAIVRHWFRQWLVFSVTLVLFLAFLQVLLGESCDLGASTGNGFGRWSRPCTLCCCSCCPNSCTTRSSSRTGLPVPRRGFANRCATWPKAKGFVRCVFAVMIFFKMHVEAGSIDVSPSAINQETQFITVDVSVPLDRNTWVTPKFLCGKELTAKCTLARGTP